MNRWAALVGFAVLLGACLFRWEPSVASVETKPAIIGDPDALKVMNQAVVAMGYHPKGLVGQDWGVEGCSVHSYVADLQEEGPPVFFTRDLQTDEISVLTSAEFNSLMRLHIRFDGGFVPVLFGQSEVDRYYFLGRLPGDPDRADIWVRFDQTACGLVVDRFWIRRYSKGSEYVDVRIPVLP